MRCTVFSGQSVRLPDVFRQIKFHPLFLALLLLTAGIGYWRQTLVLFLLVLLHELGHAAAAQAVGFTVEKVSLLPFGGVATLSYGDKEPTPRRETIVAIAGPLVNLLLIFVAVLMHASGVWSSSFAAMVVSLNLWISVFNLIPALPLDGGRVWRAARSRHKGYESATREAYRMAIGVSITLLIVAGVSLWAGYPHIGVLVLGIFLLQSAWSGRRHIASDVIRFLDAKKRHPAPPTQAVRALAAPLSATVKEVVRQFAPDRYHVVYVLGADKAVQTVLEEDQIIAAVFAGHWLWTLSQLLD